MSDQSVQIGIFVVRVAGQSIQIGSEWPIPFKLAFVALSMIGNSGRWVGSVYKVRIQANS